jgi:hypothetical protein
MKIPYYKTQFGPIYDYSFFHCGKDGEDAHYMNYISESTKHAFVYCCD